MSVKASEGPAATSFQDPRRTGFLVKHGGTGFGANWRKRWFILDHGYMFYYKGDKDRKPVGVVSLSDYKRCYKPPYKKGNKSKFLFVLEKDDSLDESESQARNYEMYSENEEDTQDWIDAINAEIKTAYTSRGNRISKIDDKSFDQLVTSTEEQPKLVHLTANRPKMKGRRPPQRYKTFHEDEDAASDDSPSIQRKTSAPSTPSPQPSPEILPKKGHKPSVALRPPKPRNKSSEPSQDIPEETQWPSTSPPADSNMPTPAKIPPSPPTKPRPPPDETTEVTSPVPIAKPRPPPAAAKPRRVSTEIPNSVVKEPQPVANDPQPIINEQPDTKTEAVPSAKPRPPQVKPRSATDVSQTKETDKFKKPLPPGKAKRQLPPQSSVDNLVSVIEEKPAEETPQPKARPVPKPRTKTMASPEHLPRPQLTPVTKKLSPADNEPPPQHNDLVSNEKQEPRYINVGRVSATNSNTSAPPTPNSIESDDSDEEEPPPPPQQGPPSSKLPPTTVEIGEPPLQELPSPVNLPQVDEPPLPPQTKPPPSKPAPPVQSLSPSNEPSSLPLVLTPPSEEPPVEEPLVEEPPVEETFSEKPPSDEPPLPPLSAPPPSKEAPPLPSPPPTAEDSPEDDLPPPPPSTAPPPSKSLPSPPSPEPAPLTSSATDNDYDVVPEESLYDKIVPKTPSDKTYNIPLQSHLSTPEPDPDTTYSVPRTPTPIHSASPHVSEYDVPKVDHYDVPRPSSNVSLGISSPDDVDLPESFGFRSSQVIDPALIDGKPPSAAEGPPPNEQHYESLSSIESRASQYGPPPERDGWGYAIVNKQRGSTKRKTESPHDWLALHVQKPEDYASVPEALQKAREILRLAKIVKMEADEARKEVERELALARRDRLDAEILKKNAAEILKMAKEKLKTT